MNRYMLNRSWAWQFETGYSKLVAKSAGLEMFHTNDE